MAVAGQSITDSESLDTQATHGPLGRGDRTGWWRWVPWGVWLVVSAATFWLVAAHGFTMPYADEWAWFPVVSGQQPVTAEWLWSQHNEHRMVLPRLIYLGLGSMSGYDFRAGAFYNVAVLSGLAALTMLMARRLRGRTSLFDAFFPLLMLNWGQFINLGWGFQLNFVTSVGLAVGLLVLVIGCRQQLSLSGAVLATACLVGLGLCGGYGLAYVPAGAAWLVFAGASRWRAGGVHSRRDGAAMFVLAAVSLGFVGVYLIGFRGPGRVTPGLLASARTAVQFLSGGIGPIAKESWPISGLLIAAAIGLSLRQALRVAIRRPDQRVRAVGLCCFVAAVVSLGLAIGWGRAHFGPRSGFMDRFSTLGMPLLCLFYLQAVVYSSPGSARHIFRALLLTMCVLTPINTVKGLRYAARFEGPMQALEADVRAGLPSDALATRHAEPLGCVDGDAAFAGWMDALRRDGLGPYRNLPILPPDDSLSIERLARAQQPAEPARIVRLAIGETFADRFDVAGPAELRRIDVQLKKWRRGRRPTRLDWSLCRVDPDGVTTPVAGGQVDLDRLAWYDYATLDLGGIPVAGPEQYELALRMPDGAAKEPSRAATRRCAEIPLYRPVDAVAAVGAAELDSGAELKGFVYLARQCGVARRPGKSAAGLR